MESIKRTYKYEGVVLRFGKVVDNKYTAYTTAVSKEHALNLFKAKWKKDNNLQPWTKVELPSAVTEVE